MRYVNSEEWEALKRHSARHLTDPHWLGGGHGIPVVTTERVELTTHQLTIIVRAPNENPATR